jgi:hypothetical protein
MGIRRADWQRVRREVACLRKPLAGLQTCYSILFGFAASAGASIYPIAYSTGLPTWILPLYILTTIFSTVTALVFVGLDIVLRSKRKSAIDVVNMDMQDIEQMFSPCQPSQPSPDTIPEPSTPPPEGLA